MYKITKEDLYDKREMKTRRKINTTFNCPTCEEKVSIKTHTYFYLISEHLTGPLDSGRYCSTNCLFKHLDTLSIDIDEIIEEHNAMMDKLYVLDKS